MDSRSSRRQSTQNCVESTREPRSRGKKRQIQGIQNWSLAERERNNCYVIIKDKIEHCTPERNKKKPNLQGSASCGQILQEKKKPTELSIYIFFIFKDEGRLLWAWSL